MFLTLRTGASRSDHLLASSANQQTSTSRRADARIPPPLTDNSSWILLCYRRMRRKIDFFIDGFHYLFLVGEDNQVAFCLQESNHKTRMVPDEDLMMVWGQDDDIITSFDETGVCRKPVELFRKVAALTVEWIKTAKPSYFWLQTPNEKKKHIYRRMIERFGKEVLNGFQIVEYDDAIYFYKDTTLPMPP